MELVFYPLLVIVALSGVLIGRWWALLIPLVAWPTYFLGVANEWWGYGLATAGSSASCSSSRSASLPSPSGSGSAGCRAATRAPPGTSEALTRL